jgi:two-component system NtrC family sensor kinase
MERLQPLASIGLVSAMIAHELNNILTPLANYAQLAIDNPEDRELREKALRKTVLNCDRACKIQQSLLALASGRNQNREIINIRTLIDDVFACLCRDFRKEGISVITDIPDNLEVPVVSVQLQQVIMNLVLNARDALLPGGGRISITARKEQDRVLINVSDTGPGIAPEVLPRIFEPFVTTKAGQDSDSSNGFGLGLAFCREVVTAHGGTITAESSPGQGATFRITLPL